MLPDAEAATTIEMCVVCSGGAYRVPSVPVRTMSSAWDYSCQGPVLSDAREPRSEAIGWVRTYVRKGGVRRRRGCCRQFGGSGSRQGFADRDKPKIDAADRYATLRHGRVASCQSARPSSRHYNAHLILAGLAERRETITPIAARDGGIHDRSLVIEQLNRHPGHTDFRTILPAIVVRVDK